MKTSAIKNFSQFEAIYENERKGEICLEAKNEFNKKFIESSIPISILNNKVENGTRKVNYDSNKVGLAGEWVFSYKLSEIQHNTPHKTYSVSGKAMLIHEKRVIKIHESFSDFETAQQFLTILTEIYPESHLYLSEVNENIVIEYG